MAPSKARLPAVEVERQVLVHVDEPHRDAEVAGFLECSDEGDDLLVRRSGLQRLDDEASELLRSALVSIEGDAEATLRERYDLLMALIDDYRWAALLPQLVERAGRTVNKLGGEVADPQYTRRMLHQAAAEPTRVAALLQLESWTVR